MPIFPYQKESESNKNPAYSEDSLETKITNQREMQLKDISKLYSNSITSCQNQTIVNC